MGQKDGEKWTAAVDSQPTLPKPDRLLALSDWYRLEENGQLSERKDPSPGTLDGLAEMLDGKAEHRLATVDEALAVVRIIEALLAD